VPPSSGLGQSRPQAGQRSSTALASRLGVASAIRGDILAERDGACKPERDGRLTLDWR